MSLAAALASAYGASPRGWAGFLSRADFIADLLYTAIPQRAASGTTATFTRATARRWKNNDGYEVVGLAGEIDFPGARRVRNLQATSSEPTSGWTAAGATPPTVTYTTLDGSGAVSMAFPVVAAGYANSRCSGPINSVSWVQNSTKIATQMVVSLSRALTGSEALTLYLAGTSALDDVIVFNASNSPTSAVLQSVVDTFVNPTFSGTMGITVYVSGAIVGSPVTLSLTRIQFEDVTAQTTQTAGEYVSVGVPSDWAGTELVTNGTFDTSTTGWTAVNSTFSQPASDLRITNVGANAGYGHQAITTVIGTKYVCSANITLGTSSTFGVYFGNSPGSGALGGINGSASGLFTAEFTATATTTYISPINTQAVDGRYTTFDNISVKPAYYHGSFVDGVKCFPTDLSGNPIPSTTMLGYQAEGARTNLCLQSNAFTTTWVNNAALTVTQDAIGPDGATSAWTLTQTAGALRFLTQTIGALTAANYTLLFFVKKTTGAQSTYPVFNLYAAVPAKICGVTVDTTNGVATVWTSWTGLTVVTSSATCVSHNANYWRVSLTGLLTTDSWRVTLIPAGATSATQATGEPLNTTAGSAVFYGAQVELGSFASSPIATTTAAVTRNADVLTYSGGDIANLKTLTATFRRESGVSAASEVLALSDNTLNNTVVMQMDNATLVRSYGVAGGVTQWNQTASNSYTAGSDSKVAVTFATNDVKSFFAGTSMTADTSATVPVVTRLEVGMVTSLYQLYGTTKGIYGWTRNLSQSELQAVTA